jgi:PHP family Zn ribbon phosphoesterase
MVRKYLADLHIHTCLSPCADLDNSPRAIIQQSKEKKLDIIGVTDHNSAEHVLIAVTLGREAGIWVLPGIEVSSAEEIHLLALFENAEEALIFQGYVYDHMPDTENDPEVFGYQPVVNRDDEILYFNPRLLIGATDLPIEQLIAKAHQLNGIVIASHVDREAFSLISQLGMIPADLDLDALEISPRMTVAEARTRFGPTLRFPLITASDAHSLGEIGTRTTSFFIEEPSLKELKLALRNEQDRNVQE